MNKGLVSVVIPTFNNAAYISECIESIENQTYRNIEVIIVDDGSTDNTELVVGELAKKYTNIVYKKISNSKSPTARNIGFGLAKGQYVASVDSDDLWPTNKVEDQVRILEANPGVIVLGQAQNFTVDERGEKKWGEITVLPTKGLEDDYLDLVMSVRLNQMVLLNTFMADREIILNHGLWDPKFVTAHDWENWVRLAKKFKFVHVNKVFQLYRKHSGSTTRHHKKYQALNYQIAVVNLHSKDRTWSRLKALEYKRIRYDSWIHIYMYVKQFRDAFGLLLRSYTDSNMLFSFTGIRLTAECVLTWLRHVFSKRKLNADL